MPGARVVEVEQPEQEGGDAEVEFHLAVGVGAQASQVTELSPDEGIGSTGSGRRNVEGFRKKGEPRGQSGRKRGMEADVDAPAAHPLVVPHAGGIDHGSAGFEVDLAPVSYRGRPGTPGMVDQFKHGMAVNGEIFRSLTAPTTDEAQRHFAEDFREGRLYRHDRFQAETIFKSEP